MQEIKRLIWVFVYWFLGRFFPQALVTVIFRRCHGMGSEWKSNPQTIDQKIHWLKFYGDTSQWPRLADKYRVREYVAECGLADMLVPLLGRWERAEDIDWDSLPERFVMKTNHGSGDALICQDKAQLDTGAWTQKFARLLRERYGYYRAEPHYNLIPPCIIAEELLDASRQKVESTSLVDYKVWAFNGKPAYVWTCHNRTKDSCVVGVYDLDWRFHPEYSVSNSHYILASQPIPRPSSLDRILHAASVLSEGFPQARVDFYEVDGKPYFGEITFTAASGFNDFYTREFLLILGRLCILPLPDKNESLVL